MKSIRLAAVAGLILLATFSSASFAIEAPNSPDAADSQVERDSLLAIPADALRDKIRGGLLGQLLGNLNGLQHEMKYIDNPGNVAGYVPALPDGAWTDDDTDFEWVYIVEMQQRNNVLLPPAAIRQLWQTRINKRIWCANQYARQLMDLGLAPPMTGKFALNPWAEFNISGQFLCESFGLIAPAMPQTAGRIGLNYTQVAIDLEPAQTTQLFTAMIATAFTTDNRDEILHAGLAAVDGRSSLHQIVKDVRQWHRENPADWRKTRLLVKQKYSLHNGEERDRNGYELNTASTVAAFLYGDGDLPKTLTMAFNFGWDCDNSAATAGTLVGVIKGYKAMMAEGWQIVDRYKNTSRENMPEDETITSFADRLIDLAEKVIADQGGQRVFKDGRAVYLIRQEKPANIASLPQVQEQAEQMRTQLSESIESGLLQGTTDQDKARAAYLAICLDLAESFREEHPQQWREGLAALEKHGKVVQAIYHHAPFPAGDVLRAKSLRAGLKKPVEKRPLW